MKAAVLHTFGQPPRFESIPDPLPNDDEVVVRVAAAALNPSTRLLASGRHYASPQQLPAVCGVEGVGRLEDGSRVFFAVRRAAQWFHVPANCRSASVLLASARRDRRRCRRCAAEPRVVVMAAADNHRPTFSRRECAGPWRHRSCGSTRNSNRETSGRRCRTDRFPRPGSRPTIQR